MMINENMENIRELLDECMKLRGQARHCEDQIMALFYGYMALEASRQQEQPHQAAAPIQPMPGDIYLSDIMRDETADEAPEEAPAEKTPAEVPKKKRGRPKGSKTKPKPKPKTKPKPKPEPEPEPKPKKKRGRPKGSKTREKVEEVAKPEKIKVLPPVHREKKPIRPGKLPLDDQNLIMVKRIIRSKGPDVRPESVTDMIMGSRDIKRQTTFSYESDIDLWLKYHFVQAYGETFFKGGE